MDECGVEDRDVVLGGPLLASVDLGCALGAGERVVHVAGQDQVDVREPGVEPRQVGLGQVRECGATRGHGLAVDVQEPRPERGEHARATVRRGAAADTEDDRPGSRVEGGGQQFPGAVRRRRERGELSCGQVLEPGGLGHLHHRGGVAHRVRRRDRGPQRAGHPRLPALEPGCHRRGDRAVPAVRDGQGLHPRPGYHAPQPGRHPLRDLHGRQRALELVRRHEHVGVSITAPSVTLHPLLSNRQSRRPDPIGTTPDLPMAVRNHVRGPYAAPVTTSDYATYIAGLPRVLAGAATLFRDGRGRVLLVEPNYREGWALPGGTIESGDGESPRQAARRETAEEIGLDLAPGRLLAVDWTRGPARPPIVAYVYDGGVLEQAQFDAIRIQEDELLSWRLVDRADLAGLLPGRLGPRVAAALEALDSGEGTVELEDGARVPA